MSKSPFHWIDGGKRWRYCISFHSSPSAFAFRIRTIFRVRNFIRHPFDISIFYNNWITSSTVRLVGMRRHGSTDQNLFICKLEKAAWIWFSICILVVRASAKASRRRRQDNGFFVESILTVAVIDLVGKLRGSRGVKVSTLMDLQCLTRARL
jgi:hypothetical protein